MPESISLAERIVALLDHFRPERFEVTHLYEHHWLGTVHLVDGTHWEACLNLTDASGHQVSCRLHYRDGYPGEGHLCTVGKTMQDIGSYVKSMQLRGKPARRTSPGWLRVLISRARAPLETASGVLLMHMDMWVHPARLPRRRRADRIWRLGAGLPSGWWLRLRAPIRRGGLTYEPVGRLPKGGKRPPRLEIDDPAAFAARRGTSFVQARCLREPSAEAPRAEQFAAVGPSDAGEGASGAFGGDGAQLGFGSGGAEELERLWFGFGSRRSGLAVSRILANASSYLGKYRKSHPDRDRAWARFEGVVCAGWSDLYYVPIGLALEFADLMTLYYWHRVFHEVAVPSILHILSNGSMEEEVVSECFGCCCCDIAPQLEPAAVLRGRACAHRVNLRDERVRSFYKQELRPLN